MATQNGTVQAPTWHGEIKDYFTEQDRDCMLQITGMDLSIYSSVVGHAPEIYQRVALPPNDRQRMPKGGEPWTKDMISNFLAWMTAGYPEGQPAPVVAARGMAAAAPVAGRVRRSLQSLEQPDIDKLSKAFQGIRALSTTDLNGFFQNAAIHGLPLAFCQHHDPGFVPWHRVQMQALEDALRSIPGCEDVTLPYWDFNELLPDWMYTNPVFASYTLPQDIGVAPGDTDPTHKAGYVTQRNPAQTIYDSFYDSSQRASVMQCIANALDAQWWDTFNGMIDGTPHIALIAAHDNGHNLTGATMSDQDISAYDPIFWFYHCNLDRVWWTWQVKHNATTLPGFMKTIQNQESISYTVFTNPVVGRMNPWADYKKDNNLTAAFSVDIVANFDAVYDQLVTVAPHPLKKGNMLMAAARKVTVKDEEVNVRVSSVNRTKIPGSFQVHLLKDGQPLRSTWFFQPNDVQRCANCLKTPAVHFDFRLPLDEVKGGELSIRVEPLKKEMYGDTVPNRVLGSPKISVSLLMDAS